MHPHCALTVPRARHRPARLHTQTRRHVRLRAREHAHRHRQGVHRPRIRPQARLSRRKGTTRPRIDRSRPTRARYAIRSIHTGAIDSRVNATDERLDRLAIGREARRDRSRGLVRGFGRQHGTRDVERARDGRHDRIGRTERSFFFARFIAEWDEWAQTAGKDGLRRCDARRGRPETRERGFFCWDACALRRRGE